MSLRTDLDTFLSAISNGRDGMPISIEEAQNITHLGRQAVIKRFRVLQDEGKGFLKLGRHGHPTRFYFASEEQPSRQAPGQNSHQEEPLQQGITVRTAETSGGTPEAHGPGSGEAAMVVHQYQLRQGLTVTLHLPSDFTDREAARFARFVETLPF